MILFSKTHRYVWVVVFFIAYTGGGAMSRVYNGAVGQGEYLLVDTIDEGIEISAP